jgi:hypothetical protein
MQVAVLRPTVMSSSDECTETLANAMINIYALEARNRAADAYVIVNGIANRNLMRIDMAVGQQREYGDDAIGATTDLHSRKPAALLLDRTTDTVVIRTRLRLFRRKGGRFRCYPPIV